MRKIILALFATLFISSLCFAQQPVAPVSQAVSKPVIVKTFTGKVDSVLIGDAAKGTKSQIAVVDENGQKLTFVVKSGTPITAKDATVLTLSGIKNGDKITVEYTTKASGTNRAQSIKVE